MKNRQIGSHDLNSRSNRSHTVTEIYIECLCRPHIQEGVDLEDAAGNSSVLTQYMVPDSSYDTSSRPRVLKLSTLNFFLTHTHH